MELLRVNCLVIKKGHIPAQKAMTTPLELLAGREHYKNYRDFLSRRGLPALIEEHGLVVDDHRIVSGGNLGLFLVTLV